jgi:histone-lysine N-methyltransferase SETMAR
VHPHTAACTRALLQHFNLELFDHPPYSPDLTLSDYHLFTYLNNWLQSQLFNSNEELMEGVKTWLSSQTADFFYAGIQNLIPRYDTCLNSDNDNV